MAQQFIYQMHQLKKYLGNGREILRGIIARGMGLR